ncbi:MAG: hypothetical protein LBK50_03430 [Candidatus Nomurabacteria bacterium]|jgi:hypothetical protein|nr:hypothetical protein [Candidatus Nomurabacteria bacterium]
MLTINLIPSIKKENLRIQHIKRLILAGCITLASASAAFLLITGLIMVGQNATKGSLRSDIQKNYQQIISTQDETEDGGKVARINRLLTMQKDIVSVNSIYGNIPITSRLFDFLRDVNAPEPNRAELDRIVVNSGPTNSSTKITATLTGVSPSFTALDAYKISLKNARFTTEQTPDVKDAELLFNSVAVTSSSFSSQRNRVSFRIVVEFNVDAFKLTVRDKKGKEVLMNKVAAFVPNQITSDSARNIPVFSNDIVIETENTESGGEGASVNGNENGGGNE